MLPQSSAAVLPQRPQSPSWGAGALAWSSVVARSADRKCSGPPTVAGGGCIFPCDLARARRAEGPPRGPSSFRRTDPVNPSGSDRLPPPVPRLRIAASCRRHSDAEARRDGLLAARLAAGVALEFPSMLAVGVCVEGLGRLEVTGASSDVASCSGVGGRARSGESHYRGVWSGEPAQSRCTTPPLCSGRARTTAGDLPPPLGALCPRKGYPSGKDERLASHPAELRRLSAVCMRPNSQPGYWGGSPTRCLYV